MSLDFPNPAGQTPANTFSPTSTPSASTNGITYTWDGSKWNAADPAADPASFLPISGGNLTGAATQTEVAIAAGGWDLSDSNFFSCGAIDVPNPTNGVNGQSGLIRFTDVPTSLGDQLILPDGFNITAACIVPFYVRAADEILLGNPVEVS